MKLLYQIITVAAIALIAVGLVINEAQAQSGFRGDPIRGGRIYDNWYNELDLPPPEIDHPLWATQDTNILTGVKTWRCVECHGWDYKGMHGAYASGLNYTGFPGVQGVIGMSHEEVMVWLDGTNDPEHNFALYIERENLDDLVAFLRTRQVDLALLVDSKTYLALGLKSSGERLYLQNCMECHGPDGKQRNFGPADAPIYLGDLVLEDPWRAIHRIRFGRPASQMPSFEEQGWTLQKVADVVSYIQTFPTGQEFIDPTSMEARAVGINLDEQGDIRPIVAGAVVIVLVIMASIGVDVIRIRRSSGGDE
jgi:thiosulfate dehydrogenase